MEFKKIYLTAMREQAPRMFNELRRSGALDGHVAMKWKQASSIYQSLITGADLLPSGIPEDLHLMRSAEEQTLAVMLDFPDESATGLKGLAALTEVENTSRIADFENDEEHNKQSAPLLRMKELSSRPFAELSQAEKNEMGRLHKEDSRATAQAIVDNLNRNVLARDVIPDPAGHTPKPIGHSTNDLFAAKDQVKLRDSNDLNSRVDPELFAAGIQLAMYNIEQRTRRFKDLAKAVALDLDVPVASIRRYLRGWYNGARDAMEDAGESLVSMDSPEEVAGFMRRFDEWSAPAPTFAFAKQKQILTALIEFPPETATESHGNPEPLSLEMTDYLHDPDAALFRAMDKRKKLKEQFPNLSNRQIFHKMFPE